MRPSARLVLLAAGLVLAGCSDETPAPTDPQSPSGPDVSAHAFQLTIDVSSGKVDVRAPRAAAMSGGASFSLLGREAVRMQATSCTFSATPGSTKQKRCTLQLSITNRLDQVALVTPSFPTPPSGSAGILVFPYTAGAQSVTGTPAVATTDWDNAPMNFFNDFGSCIGGKASDCYRSESFPLLLGGEASAPRTVGFDVDRTAQSVSMYVVVAADLGRQVSLAGTSDRCGRITERSTQMGEQIYSIQAPANLLVGITQTDPADAFRGVCSFDRAALPAGAQILGASLRATQGSVSPDVFGTTGRVTVEQIDLGASLDETDYDAAAISQIGALSTTATAERKSLDVTAAVLDDIADGRARSEFRLRLVSGSGGVVGFDGPSAGEPPELVIVYSEAL